MASSRGWWHLAAILVLGLPQAHVRRVHRCERGRRMLQLLCRRMRKVREVIHRYSVNNELGFSSCIGFHGGGALMTYCRPSPGALVTTTRALESAMERRGEGGFVQRRYIRVP